MNYCPKHHYTVNPPAILAIHSANPKGLEQRSDTYSLPVKFLSDVNSQTAWPLDTTFAFLGHSKASDTRSLES